MKLKLFSFLGLAMLCSLFTAAQTVSTAYATQINSTFANLDKSKVPHKLLIDYAMEFEELSAFNGTLTADNFLHRGHYTGIYNTLLMARVQTGGVPSLVNPTTFRTNWENLRQPGKIVLSGLYYKYSRFKPNASPNYVTITNNKLYDKYVNGVWQNPYDEKQVFAMAAPVLLYNGLSMQVQLPLSLWYTNQSSSVQSVAIDFGNGEGYQSMAFGQIRTIAYAQSGSYEWKYKLTLTNSQILYSHSKIKIEGTSSQAPLQRTINQPCVQDADGIDFVEFDGVRTFNSVANKARLQIDYALNDCVIRRPLIIVEGFDSGILGAESIYGEEDYLRFREVSLFSAGTNLPAEIFTYDIIYVNWNKGNDDLRRNAYLLQDIIKWVNAQKAAAGSTTPNVVLGQSMGGVIARYALKDMEDQPGANSPTSEWNPKTSLFISHDAPHQGANIPLSLQYFARHMVDQFVSTPLGDMNINPNDGGTITIEQIQTLLNAQGTKQLLSNYVNASFAIDNTVFTAWQNDLKIKQYPSMRKIAISNGNHCAQQQAINPGDVLFSLSGSGRTSHLTAFLIAYFPLLQAVNGAGFALLAYLFNEPGLLVGILPGNSKFNMNFSAKALPPAGLIAPIYSGSISFTKKLFWLFNITVSLTNRNYDNSGMNPNLSYDYYPGGLFRVPFEFDNSQVDEIFGSFGITVAAVDSFDFIPIPSALDIGKGNVTLGNTDFFKRYNSVTPPVAPKDSPFANFITAYEPGSNLNERHISFNERNGDWLASEINNTINDTQVFDCSYMCANALITGADVLCSSGNYSVPASATFYNWSITQGAGLVSLSGNGTPTINLTRTNTSSGFVTVSLFLGDNEATGSRCGNATVTKTIWVGKPAFNVVRDNAQSEYCDTKWHYVNFIVNTTGMGVTNLQFIYTTPNVSHSYTGGNTYTFKFPKSFSGNFPLMVTATNACGSYSVDDDHSIGNCQSLGGPNMSGTDGEESGEEAAETDGELEKVFRAYPNPADDFVKIELRDSQKKPVKDDDIVAKLYNLMGEEKSSVKINDNVAVLNTVGLPKGIYVLKIMIGGNVEHHQIAVK